MDEQRSHFVNVLSKLTIAEIVDGVKNEISVLRSKRTPKRSLVNYVVSTASLGLLHDLEVLSRFASSGHQKRGRSSSPGCERLRRMGGSRSLSESSLRISSESDSNSFFELPSEDELKSCHRNFFLGTSNDALATFICAVCGRESNIVEGETRACSRHFLLHEVPHVEKLIPSMCVFFFGCSLVGL